MSRNNAQQLAQQEEARKNKYTGMIQSAVAKVPDDYTASQKADITTAEMGGIDVGFGNLKDEMLRRASATSSAAGLPESLSEANRDATRQKADAGAKLQEMFANVPVQRALQQASIFQPALSGMLYNRYPQQSGGVLNSIIGAGGGAGAAAIVAF
jgi:hypothetical protein